MSCNPYAIFATLLADPSFAHFRHVWVLDNADEIARCKPIYESIPGWTDSTVGVTDYDKLPVNARLYLQRIAHVTGVPIDLISTSPDRDHTIMQRHPYLG